jgi:hypothetical protein
MQKAVIVDIDGTVANRTNRDPYDYSKVLDDAPKPDVIEVVSSLWKAGHKIIFVTARDDSCYDDTFEWLRLHCPPFMKLYMRKTGDNRNDSSTGAIRNGDGKYYCSWGLTQVNVCGGAGPAYLKLYGKENASDSDKLAVIQNTEKHLDFVILKVKELFPSTWQQERTPEEWAQDFAIEYERCAECKSANDSQVVARRKEASGLKTQSFYTGINIGSVQQATTLDTIIIGDSHTDCLEKNIVKGGGKARRISPIEGESSLWQVGKGVSWLIGALKKYPVTTSVKNVIVSIGTNGGFNTLIDSVPGGDDQAGLMAELARVFPNAKYIFVKGSYGWGGNVGKTAYDVLIYYLGFESLGATTVEGIGQVTDAQSHYCNLGIYSTITSNIIRLVGG